MTDLEQILERVALECTNLPQEPASGYLRDVRLVLKARLLPLLEAGQAMRQLYGPNPDEEMPDPVIVAWDAAVSRLRSLPF